MKSEVKKIDSVQAELSVELSREELDLFVAKAEAGLGKNLEVDGFRKGKVPKDLIKKYVDPKTILDTALELALKESLAESIREKDLDVLNVSDLQIKENSPQKLVYSVLLIQFPSINISDLNFKVKKKDIQVDKKEIDATVDSIKSSRAKLIDKNGPAENGDRVEIDFEVKLDGQVIEGGVSKNHPLILGKKTLIPGFEDNLVGMSVKQEKDFSLVAPKDYPHKLVAGKKLDVHVVIQNLKKVEPPELNDAFIHELGKFDNLDQLLASVKEGLMEEKKEKEKQRVRLEILSHIINNSSIIVPKHMAEEQLEEMINNFDSDLHKNGMELGPYLAHLNKTRDDLKNDWRPEAEKQVKTILVIHKIARDKKISAEPEEIEPALNEMAQALILRGSAPGGGLEMDKLRDTIATRIINEKTLQFLEDHCT